MQSCKFESLVNTEGFQTEACQIRRPVRFESLVNTEGFQTLRSILCDGLQFESLVNTEGFQTIIKKYRNCLTSTNSPDILYDCCGERKQHGFLKRNSKK